MEKDQSAVVEIRTQHMDLEITSLFKNTTQALCTKAHYDEVY